MITDVFTKILLSLQLLVLVLGGGGGNRTGVSVSYSWFPFLVAIQVSKSFGLALALAPFSYPVPRNSCWLHRNSFSQTLPSNCLALAPPSPTRVSRQQFWRPGLAPSKESSNKNCKSTCMQGYTEHFNAYTHRNNARTHTHTNTHTHTHSHTNI